MIAGKRTLQGDAELADEWTNLELADHIRRGDPCAYGEVVRILTARIAATTSAGKLTTPREAAHDLSCALASIAVIVARIGADITDGMDDDDADRLEIEGQARTIDQAASDLRGLAEGWI
jgi:hypothetical protein